MSLGKNTAVVLNEGPAGGVAFNRGSEDDKVATGYKEGRKRNDLDECESEFQRAEVLHGNKVHSQHEQQCG